VPGLLEGDAPDLLEMVRRELAPAEGANRLIPLVDHGRLPRDRLAALAGEEYWIGESDRRSFLFLAARFPEPPAVDFFLGLAAVEGPARESLLRFAGALGLGETDLAAYEPKQAARRTRPMWPGSRSTDRRATSRSPWWRTSPRGARTADRSPGGCGATNGLGDDEVAFFDFFATPAPEVERLASAVARHSLGPGGTLPDSARRHARMVQGL